MAESGQENRSPITLAERFDRYRVAVQQVVERGIEHPSYELKRAVTISKENLADRLVADEAAADGAVQGRELGAVRPDDGWQLRAELTRSASRPPSRPM